MSKSFIKYPKIHRLGADENEGILDSGWVCVQEKIDGANTSIWYDSEENVVKMASRNQLLHAGTTFNGFCAYVDAHAGIQACVRENPSYRLFGEWLVRHTIAYEEHNYNNFYLFDIFQNDTTWMHPREVEVVGIKYDIKMPVNFISGSGLQIGDILPFAGQTTLGARGEGIVIKAPDFRNKFGEPAHAKVVTQAFKEDNGVVFGGNSKHSETYEEMRLVNKYMTLGRMQKVVHNLESTLDRKLDAPDTERVINTAYHDLITEECWTIARTKKRIDFKALAHLCLRKAARIYSDLLAGHLSVAYTHAATTPQPTPAG